VTHTGPSLKRKNSKQHAPPKPHSITEVNRKSSHGLGVWGNPRVVMGVRVDSELKKRFKLVAKRVFGSVCNPIEAFMATVVSCAESEVNFGNTVEVGTIVIERNLRPRRNLDVQEPKPIEISTVPKCDFCGKMPVVGSFRHNSGIMRRACGYHASQLRNHEKWKEKKS